MTAPGRRRDRGSASLEFLGMLPILLLIALAGLQLGLAAYTAAQAGTAARAAARMEAVHDRPVSGAAAGTQAVSSWLRDGTEVTTAGGAGDSVQATATVEIPSVFPGFSPGSVTRTATMPREDDEGADE